MGWLSSAPPASRLCSGYTLQKNMTFLRAGHLALTSTCYGQAAHYSPQSSCTNTAMKRTFQPSVLKRSTHGFRARIATKSGRQVMAVAGHGRKRLAANPTTPRGQHRRPGLMADQGFVSRTSRLLNASGLSRVPVRIQGSVKAPAAAIDHNPSHSRLGLIVPRSMFGWRLRETVLNALSGTFPTVSPTKTSTPWLDRASRSVERRNSPHARHSVAKGRRQGATT